VKAFVLFFSESVLDKKEVLFPIYLNKNCLTM